MAGWKRWWVAGALLAGSSLMGCTRVEDRLQERAWSPQPPPGAGTQQLEEALRIEQQQRALKEGRGGPLQPGQGGAGPDLAWSHTFSGTPFEPLAVNPSWPSIYLISWPQYDGVVDGTPEPPPSWGFERQGWETSEGKGAHGVDRGPTYPSR